MSSIQISCTYCVKCVDRKKKKTIEKDWRFAQVRCKLRNIAIFMFCPPNLNVNCAQDMFN